MQQTITKIERQKKNKNRYSLFVGEQFIIGVSEETLLFFDIHVGKDLSNTLIEKIRTKEVYVSVREQAWRFLARREHSRSELRDKLLNKSFPMEIIQQILTDLVKRDYLNDYRYARLVLNDEINLKKAGPLLIKGKLKNKGVELNIISELLEELYPEEVQISNCRHIADKKRSLLNNLDPHKQRKRLISYLAQKGYSWDIIERSL